MLSSSLPSEGQGSSLSPLLSSPRAACSLLPPCTVAGRRSAVAGALRALSSRRMQEAPTSPPRTSLGSRAGEASATCDSPPPVSVYDVSSSSSRERRRTLEILNCSFASSRPRNFFFRSAREATKLEELLSLHHRN
eukprot:765361-Hanusia_phi.AAC.1